MANDSKRAPSRAPAEVSSSPANGRSFVIDRRDFFKLTGLGLGAASLPGLAGCDPLVVVPNLTATALRKEDFVVLRFDFVGLDLNAEGDKLVAVGSGQRFIIVTHASQHIAEQAYLENPEPYPPPAQPVESRLAGTSRVVFRVPSDVTELGYDLESLLAAIRTFEMNVSGNAAPPNASGGNIIIGPIPLLPIGNGGPSSSAVPTPGQISTRARRTRAIGQLERSTGVAVGSDTVERGPIFNIPGSFGLGGPSKPTLPTELETALEVPYRLIISPNEYGGWAHSPSAVEWKGRTELWHSRLGVRLERAGGTVVVDESEANAKLRTFRALWTRDEAFVTPEGTAAEPPDPTAPPPNELPFISPLTTYDRARIVHKTSNFDKPGPDPKAVDVNRLMLTGLGAWLDSSVDFGADEWLDLISWKHRGTMGRDHFVEIVNAGYISPFGHDVVLVKVTERKFRPGYEHVAYLWQRFFLVARQRVRAYPSGLRELPFTEVALKLSKTPDLELPLLQNGQPDENNPFLAVVNGKPFLMPMQGVDRAGNTVHFRAAFVWVPAGQTGQCASQVGADGELPWHSIYAPHAEAAFDGQRVAFAPPIEIDDTTFQTKTISFRAICDGTSGKPGFAPALAEAKLDVEALRELTGNPQGTAFQYAEAYKAHGFGTAGQNEGKLLFEVKGSPIDLSFNKKSGSTGGFVAPGMFVSGLSPKTGPVGGDVGTAASNQFEPESFLGKIDAKLFGVFQLSQIIKAVGGLDNAPKFVTQTLDVVEGFLNDIEGLKRLASDYKSELEGFGVSLGNLPSVVDDIVGNKVPAVATAFGAIDGDDLTGSVQNILTSIDALDQAFESLLNAIDGVDPKFASGLRQTAVNRVQQIRNVINAPDGLRLDTHPVPLPTNPIVAFAQAAELAKNLTVRLEWRPEIQGDPLEIFDPINKYLILSVEIRGKDLPGKPAGVDLVASLENFRINLIGDSEAFMRLLFEKVQFRAQTGKKPEVDVVFDDIVFDGILAFVQKLRDVIPFDGFSDPPAVEVSLEGIRATFSIPLPNVAVGMFSLENMSLSAGFHIPFIGPPVTVSFGFCSREKPFTLTVSMLGGGGFFGISVSPAGVEILEAALEFGASLSVDFGVASGSVSIMAGVYFRMELDEASLTGYLRIRGEVDVLGLISASITMLMELIYEFSSHKLIGRATIEIEVSVFCFSATVSVTAERKFAGSNEDPTFKDLMEPIGNEKPWNEYLAAFAA